ncbi:hypothetical protein MicroSTF_14190 [Microbacterium sp. STF-2]|uniref:hypothetical protein n=1 Tax=Microbacterium sp. STF-2 TaxID=3031132 RepID=UPI002AFE0096|nr:hypothetical protein [Microbacterium sp. STF-2]MEA1264189.1 hypothetical protein [Microbacterium sp. STF-2]
MDTLSDFWLPLVLAVLGIGGTIAVTIVQLRARRAELNDERAAREAAELERRREAVIEAVYDAIGPLTSAATVPREKRNVVPHRVTVATAKAARIIRLCGREDRTDLHEWFAIRARHWGTSTLDGLGELESAMLAEIDAWFDGRATAAEIREKAAAV